MDDLWRSRRARLIALLVISTAAISVLAFRAAGASAAYYVTPTEFRSQPALQNARVRVAGRVVEGSIATEAGRPIAFTIVGDAQDEVAVRFPKGVVPNLFGPYALVIVEGRGRAGTAVDADAVIIKHENEFYAGKPPEGSISSHFVPTPGPAAPAR